MKLFYFVADSYPAWRFDVVELFGIELPKKGVEVTWSMRRGEAGACTVTEQNGQRVHLPASFGRASSAARISNRVLEAACEVGLFFSLVFGPRYDIIQVRDDRYLAGFWAWLAARLTGARFIYWLSFPFPENDAEKSLRSRGLKRIFLKTRAAVTEWWLYRFLLRRADHAFVQSEEMLNGIAARGIPRDRMTPVPMAIPERLLLKAAEQRSEAVPARVVYIGTLAAGRRLEMIIDAFALVLQRCPHAELYMVGAGDVPGEREALERRVSELGIATSVRFTGFVPVQKAWEILGTAMIGLSPIFVDRVLRVGSPTKLIEYMAMSKPTVCNDHPEQSAVIRDSGAGRCVPWSADAFASAICELLVNPDEAARLGRCGPDWVRQHRTYSIIADAVQNRYRDLLGARQ
jgi:glycosyltransferase involved in cell wall biosynthesis